MIDVAYPIRGGQMAGPDPLKWSLRCLSQHAEVARVFIAGEAMPPWINPEAITFLEVPFTGHKREHSGHNLEAVLSSNIGSRFLWMNDDFFILEDRDEWPIWCSLKPLREEIEALTPRPGRQYADGLREMLELLEEWGVLEPPSLELHTPILFDKRRIARIYARARREAPPTLEAGFFRTLYLAGGPLELEPIEDVKVYGYRDRIPAGATMVSSHPVSWNVGELGKAIRKRYWRPSKWEL